MSEVAVGAWSASFAKQALWSCFLLASEAATASRILPLTRAAAALGDALTASGLNEEEYFDVYFQIKPKPGRACGCMRSLPRS